MLSAKAADFLTGFADRFASYSACIDHIGISETRLHSKLRHRRAFIGIQTTAKCGKARPIVHPALSR